MIERENYHQFTQEIFSWVDHSILVDLSYVALKWWLWRLIPANLSFRQVKNGNDTSLRKIIMQGIDHQSCKFVDLLSSSEVEHWGETKSRHVSTKEMCKVCIKLWFNFHLQIHVGNGSTERKSHWHHFENDRRSNQLFSFEKLYARRISLNSFKSDFISS